MTVSKITNAPTQKELIDKTNEIIDNLGGGGSSTDVQINGTSITSGGVANIVTNSAYDASSNKIATMSDLSGKQDTLVSGTNIKTVNNTSLLGSGDISVGSYSAGTGLSLSGTTFNHSNSVTAGTIGTSSATSGSTISVPYATYDAQGHITAKGTHTHTVTGFLTSSSTEVASSRFDGQWVYSFQTLGSGLSFNNSNDQIFSLSNYLPNDNYNYEVIVSVHGRSGTSSGNNIDVSVFSDLIQDDDSSHGICVAVAQTRTSSFVYGGGAITIPVGTGRSIGLHQNSSGNCTDVKCVAFGYRRIGTNQ